MTSPKPPFFIVGCVRSGTTMLRDLLRLHPNLDCPEETHIFRWPEPFGGSRFVQSQQNNPVLAGHRQMDGVSEQAFDDLLANAQSRKDLQDAYGEAFMARKNGEASRWFDKTPQNAYGLLLLSACYPHAKILHIHRHPYNVVASLKIGKVMPPRDLRAAINTWLESILILERFKSAWPDSVLEIAYESLTGDVGSTLDQITTFIDEPAGQIQYQPYGVHPEQNKYREVLSANEIETIKVQLATQMAWYGYE